MRALKREHLGVDEPTDVLSFPIDGRERCRRACRARSATSSSARRSSATTGAGRSSTGCCTCSGYDHGDEMEARESARDATSAGR